MVKQLQDMPLQGGITAQQGAGAILTMIIIDLHMHMYSHCGGMSDEYKPSQNSPYQQSARCVK